MESGNILLSIFKNSPINIVFMLANVNTLIEQKYNYRTHTTAHLISTARTVPVHLSGSFNLVCPKDLLD